MMNLNQLRVASLQMDFVTSLACDRAGGPPPAREQKKAFETWVGRYVQAYIDVIIEDICVNP